MGGVISTPSVVISAPFGVEIRNSSAHIALCFVISTPNSAEITIISVEISFPYFFYSKISL